MGNHIQRFAKSPRKYFLLFTLLAGLPLLNACSNKPTTRAVQFETNEREQALVKLQESAGIKITIQENIDVRSEFNVNRVLRILERELPLQAAQL